MLRRSYTAVIDRNATWSGSFATEPYEASWASEAIFFIRSLDGNSRHVHARVQISPDGIHWCDEGTDIRLPDKDTTSYCRVVHFGGWLRLVGQTEDDVTVMVTLCLKE